MSRCSLKQPLSWDDFSRIDHDPVNLEMLPGLRTASCKRVGEPTQGSADAPTRERKGSSPGGSRSASERSSQVLRLANPVLLLHAWWANPTKVGAAGPSCHPLPTRLRPLPGFEPLPIGRPHSRLAVSAPAIGDPFVILQATRQFLDKVESGFRSDECAMVTPREDLNSSGGQVPDPTLGVLRPRVGCLQPREEFIIHLLRLAN